MGIRTLLVAGLAATAAGSARAVVDRYDLRGKPTWEVTLSSDLAEISGLALAPDGGVVAHGDEEIVGDRVCEAEGPAHDRVAIYAWSPGEQRLAPDPRLVVPYVNLARVTGAKAFNGSALAFAPDGRSLLLIAGPQRLFAEVGPDGRVLGGGRLDPKVHRQPEGLAFTRDGTLLIGNEAARGEPMLAGDAPRPGSRP